jgi:outer membrane protein assembly factor BamB
VVYLRELVLLLFLGAAGLSTARAQTNISTLWSFSSPSSSEDSPALAPDGSIYFGTWLGQLIALNPDGSRKWGFAARREIWSSPAVGDDGTIYFGSRDHCCYALTPQGKLRWRFHTGGWVDSSPAVAADGTIYFGSWDTNLYALHPDGSLAWGFPSGGPIDSSPAIGTDGHIYFGSHDHKFYALRPNGTKAWDFSTGAPIISSPALDRDGTVYFTSVDGCLYAVKADGTLKWRVRTGGITQSSPVLGEDGTIYVGVNKLFWAVSPEGRKLWDQHATWDAFQEPIEASPTALADNSVLIISDYGLLTDFAEKGTVVPWHIYIFAHGAACPAVGPGGNVYISGRTHAEGPKFLALPTRVPLAQSPWPKFRGNAQNTGRLAPLAAASGN